MRQDLEDIQSLFEQVVAAAPEKRLALLSRLTGDPAVQQRVLRLIDAAERSEAFMPTGTFRPEPFSPKLATGDLVGEWKVTGFLGIGGMGEVYSAERRKETFVQRGALKTVSPAASEQQRFLTERALLARLEHPNIARLIDGGSDPAAGAFMVMEHVEGVDLIAATGDMREPERLKLFLDLCGAVSYAHARLILHRDIKPSNILIDANGRLRLIDFGVGLDMDTGSGGVIAPMTSDYAAPEQKDGRAVTVETDVFALGVVLRELLTGSRLRQEGRPPARDAAAIIEKATGQNPAERYNSVAALADDVASYMAGGAVAARKGGRAYRTSRFIRRHWLTSTTAGLLVASLAGGLFVTSIWAERAERAADLAERTLHEREFEASTMSGYRHALQALYGIDEIDNVELDHALARIARGAAGNLQSGQREDTFLVYAIGQNFMYRDDHAFAAEVLAPFADEGLPVSDVVIDAKSNLARALSESGRIEEAAELVDQLRIIRKASGNASPADIAQELMITANWTGREEDFRAVIANAEQAIKLAEPIGKVGYYYNQMGTAWLALGEWQKAVDAMATAFEEGRPEGIRTPDDITAAENLALLTIFLTGDSTSPLEYLPEYAEAAEVRFQSPQKASFLYGLIAECSLMNDQPELAASASDNALRLIGSDYSYRSGWPLDLLSIKARAHARLGLADSAKENLEAARTRAADPEIAAFLEDGTRKADLSIRLDLAEAELLAFSGETDAAASFVRDAIRIWQEQTGLDTLTPGIQTLLSEAERVTAGKTSNDNTTTSQP